MNDQRDPSEPPDADNKDAAKPAPTRTSVIPRPSEVHPLNAVTGTPPPVEVMESLTETELPPLTVEGERPSTEPATRSSAPPERISLVPHSRLATRLSASVAPNLATRVSLRPQIPAASPSAPPDLEVVQPLAPTEAPASDLNRSSSKAPRPSFTPTQSQPPSLTLTSPSVGPARASSPATPQVPGPSFRPSGLGRLNTSLPPASLKAKGLRPTSMPPILDKVALVNEEPIACEANENAANEWPA